MLKMKNKLKKILEVVTDILLVFILIIAIVITVMTFTSKNSDVGVGNVFGYTPFTIQSDSMKPAFATGDMIIAKEVKNVNELKIGDVITYTTVLTDSEGRSVRGNNTHRIIDIEYNSDGTINNFITKGDAISMEDTVPVTPDSILGKQVNSGYDEEAGLDANGDPVIKEGLKISSLGSALNFLQSRTGFMICVIIPLALFFIWQIYKLIMMFVEAKTEDIDEDIKRRAIEEYLAEQESKKKASGDSDADTTQENK
jgi:signal peptidase